MLTRDRVLGMFLGIAIGDALFMPVETFSKDEIASRFGRITDYITPPNDHRWFAGKEAGTWTDDTELTLAIADSLIECGRIDMNSITERHVLAYLADPTLGYGGSTTAGIKNLIAGKLWSVSGISDNPKRGSGNGLPMKVAPIGAYLCSLVRQQSELTEAEFVRNITDLTLMTHYTKMAVQSALTHIQAIRFCLCTTSNRFDKEFFVLQLLYAARLATEGNKSEDNLLERIVELSNSNLDWSPEAISERYGQGSCYVYNSLPFSYAFFLRNPTSIETLYDVGNAGGDTDTNASIVGGMLGALNGTAIFPNHLIEGLKQKERILQTAERFCQKFEITD